MIDWVMSERITGTSFIITDDPRVAATTFLGDPLAGGAGSAASYISVFDPTRGAAPINLSIPWLTSLKNLTGLPPFSVSQLGFAFLNIASITFDNLVSVEDAWQISITETNNYSLNFPALTTFNGSIFDSGQTLVSIDCPEVTLINSISQNIVLSSPVLNTLNFPKLAFLMGDVDANNAALTSLNFPALRTLDNGVLDFTNCSLLTDITSLFGLTLVKNLSTIQINNALTTAAVNAFLVAMAANLSVASTGSTIDLSNQSPPAPPSGAGAAAKTTLQGYGLTVLTD